MGLRTFNLELANAEYDLVRWRETSSRARQCDFTLLDRNNGAGEVAGPRVGAWDWGHGRPERGWCARPWRARAAPLAAGAG